MYYNNKVYLHLTIHRVLLAYFLALFKIYEFTYKESSTIFIYVMLTFKAVIAKLHGKILQSLSK